MTFLFTAAARLVGAKFAAPFVYGVLILFAAGALFGIKSCYDNSVIENARREGNLKILREKAKADDSVTAERVKADVRREQEQTELERVTQNATTPDERRRAFHRCLRLQQQSRAAHRPAPEC